MAGKLCPNCNELAFFKTTGDNRKCSKCGYEMIIPPNSGKGGRGKKCANCGKLTVFNNKCSSCGAIYRIPKNGRV
jgi:DNA-directed RNA polymerase subunit RPC12/RpoP